MPIAPELVSGGPQIVFTGQMDYPPNIAAVQLFARQVMPAIRQKFSHARFHIVGRQPAPAVMALNGINGTAVQGRVPDVRPWLAGVDLVVAPLTIARGVQNKVLEAMAMGRAVLCTTAAATGIGAKRGAEFAVADGADALAHEATILLGDQARRDEMGAAGRRFVLASCSWDSVLTRLPELAGFPRRERRDAA